jgi:hypothetical protein
VVTTLLSPGWNAADPAEHQVADRIGHLRVGHLRTSRPVRAGTGPQRSTLGVNLPRWHDRTKAPLNGQVGGDGTLGTSSDDLIL